jgi:hypothetical protein
MSFIGTGKIKIATYSSGATFAARNFIDVGNASDFSYNFSETKKELLDYQDPAGGTAASVVKLDKVEGKIDLRVFSLSNLALALWGTATPALGVTPVSGEAHVITAGSFVPFDRIVNTAVAPVVTKGTTTVGTADYTVSAGGITIASTIGTVGVTSGDAITVSYTPIASGSLQTLISTAPLVSVFFEGVNGVDGKTTTVRMYKVKLGVAQNVSMISEDFNTLSLSFTVDKDTTVTGAGISQFLKLEVQS